MLKVKLSISIESFLYQQKMKTICIYVVSDDRKGLEKSQSFCASLAPILDEAVVTVVSPQGTGVSTEHAMCPPVIRNSVVTNSKT